MLSHELMAIVVFRLVDYSLSYDTWGQQSVTVNTIGLRRGYTGHEMLPEFGIINLASSMMQAAANGGNVWKAGALSILSSAATYGVGQLFGNASSLGKELLRAGAHGTASGVLSILSGGNFCKSFIAGAVASGTGRIAQCFTSDKLRVVAATTIAGGLSALLTGDNFMAGALSGMKIGLLNDCEHMEDDPIKDLPKDELYLDESGNVRYNYSETVICTGMPVQEMQDGNFQTNTPLDDLSHANIIVDSYGMAMLNFGGNSTIASNGKPYYHFKGEPTFNGNQYIQVRHVTEIGASITKYTKPMGRLGGPLNTLNVANGLIQDLQSPDQGFYNTSKASSQVLFSWAGASLGAQVCSEIGGMIGAYYFGAGAIPGYLLGAFIGGIAGGFWGDWFGAQVTDEIYGR